jgi:hypothetical protein
MEMAEGVVNVSVLPTAAAVIEDDDVDGDEKIDQVDE